jgi:two-component system cell cycle response regulator
MDASILVVGNEQFLTRFVNQIRSIVSGEVEASTALNEVIPLIRSRQPAILILQAAQLGCLELCHQIKEQSHLGWTYCILVDHQSEVTVNQMLSDQGRELTACAEALENGADAYLRMTAVASEEIRLLKAQIHAGLRGVQFYQEVLQTNDVLSMMALADPLTELSNRRAMEWELPRQIQNARTQSTPLSLVMLDVDYFKAVNDNYGHQVGDRVLQLLAARLRHNLRFHDTLFRYGGEEFVILLNQTSFQDAKLVAKRLRHLISDQPFQIDATLALHITVSMGLASLIATDDAKGESLIRRADHNLLYAKSSGRNQVFSGDES